MRHQLHLVTIFFLLLSALPAFSQNPTRGPVPHWVVLQPMPETVPVDPATLMGGFHYLLIEDQRHIPREQTFRHFAIHITTGDGVQNMSDIDVNYDPTYQTLQFHIVRLHQGGKIINNLSDHEIKTFQRESGMDRHLYDGSLTAVINQENVRIGDIVEYAYTITGYNPIHEGSFFNNSFQQSTVPIQEYRIKYIAGKNHPLHFQYRNDAAKPEVLSRESTIEYSWNFSDLEPLLFPDNTPIWYNPLPEIQLSSYNQWSQMVKWALPHYQINAKDSADLKALAPELTPARDVDARILQAIRFVQDEVRYLGLEGGLGAYKPNQPFLVYQRRFGDCKDKSLLLVTLLRNLGLEAHPVLVNTDLQERVANEIPSPLAFNHCIVKFQHDGRDFFVDPTISNQGGDLDHLDVLPYGKGLVLAEDTTDLDNFPKRDPMTIVIDYFFTVEEIGTSATLSVSTTYSGLRADSQRDNVLASGTQSIGQASLDYYSNAYPGITELKPLKSIDENRDGDNRFIIEENYLIEDFWSVSSADSNLLNVEITPLEMTEIADVFASADRSAPYATGSLLDIQVDITILMPEEWPVCESHTHIHGESFKYDSTLKGHGPRVEATYRYQRLQRFIPGKEIRGYLADHDEIWGDLFLNLTYDYNEEAFTFSWFVGSMAMMVFFLSLIAARNIHRNFDPAASVTEVAPLSISGWLILPALGLLVRPITILVILLADPVLFDHNTWISVFQNDNYSSFSGLGFVLGFEILANTLQLVFSLLVLWQFFKKRSSLPRLMVVLLAGGLTIILVDMILAYFLIEVGENPFTDSEQLNGLFSALMPALIWIPYFLKSSRVKQTFINRAHSTVTPGGSLDNSGTT